MRGLQAATWRAISDVHPLMRKHKTELDAVGGGLVNTPVPRAVARLMMLAYEFGKRDAVADEKKEKPSTSDPASELWGAL